jgi:hypothetical protein
MAKQFVNFALGERGGSRVRTRLDGRFYVLELFWVDIEQLWTLTLYDAERNLLRAGLVLRLGEDILASTSGPEYPGDGLGKLRVWDTTRTQQDPGRDDLKRGTAVQLVYIPAADVED